MNIPVIYYFEKYKDGDSEEGFLNKDELLNRLGIRLIKWEHAPPIKNTFQ